MLLGWASRDDVSLLLDKKRKQAVIAYFVMWTCSQGTLPAPVPFLGRQLEFAGNLVVELLREVWKRESLPFCFMELPDITALWGDLGVKSGWNSECKDQITTCCTWACLRCASSRGTICRVSWWGALVSILSQLLPLNPWCSDSSGRAK